MKQRIVIVQKIKAAIALILFLVIINSPANSQDIPTGSLRFIGAELAGTVTVPGKVKITLRTFYNGAESIVPKTETVSVFECMVMTSGKPVELIKEKEFIYDKYAPVGGNGIRSSVKSVVYSGVIDLGLFRTSYDIIWAYAGLNDIFKNIELNGNEAIALVVNISDPVTASNNNLPMLDHLPAPKVSSYAKSSFEVDVTDIDEKDKVEVLLSTPRIINASSRVSANESIERKPINEIAYKKGFSSELPIAKSLSYNQEKKEFKFDNPPFGKYILGLSISDYRDQTRMSQHQAVFIVESIF